MNKDSFIELCETYKKLLLEIIDISLFFDKCKDTCRKVGYRVKDGEVEFMPIDKELEEVSYKLQRAGQSFRGYKMDSNKLVRNYSTMTEWIGRIKETKGLKDPLDIQNAILEEMERQEREKGLVLETTGAGGKTASPGAGGEAKPPWPFKVDWQWLITTILQIIASIRR